MKIGDEVPVWWETFDGRPAGKHKAAILEIRPYVGPYSQHFTHVLKLSAPTTKNGYLEMSVKAA